MTEFIVFMDMSIYIYKIYYIYIYIIKVLAKTTTTKKENQTCKTSNPSVNIQKNVIIINVET